MLAASALYDACIIQCENITQSEIASVVGVTEMTIRKRSRMLKAIVDSHLTAETRLSKQVSLSIKFQTVSVFLDEFKQLLLFHYHGFNLNMESDKQSVGATVKCKHVVKCSNCGHIRCYDSWTVAVASAHRHYVQKGHVAVAAYQR